jgi:hypothetical protein
MCSIYSFGILALFYSRYLGAGSAEMNAKSSDISVSGAGQVEGGSAANFAFSGVAGFRLLVSEHLDFWRV